MVCCRRALCVAANAATMGIHPLVPSNAMRLPSSLDVNRQPTAIGPRTRRAGIADAAARRSAGAPTAPEDGA